MFAIVEIAGKQYRVSPQSQIVVDLLEAQPNDEINLDKVLLTSEDDGSKCLVGAPYVEKTIKAKIVQHALGEKIRIFKFRAKKRYARTQGHRQQYTVLEIGSF